MPWCEVCQRLQEKGYLLVVALVGASDVPCWFSGLNGFKLTSKYAIDRTKAVVM